MANAKKAASTTNSGQEDFESLIGPTDPKVDEEARQRIRDARVKLIIASGFFGRISMSLRLVNADSWCGTAATDGRNFYYNSRFVMKLTIPEVLFLVGHEILHVIYDHMDRRGTRNPVGWNIAADYAINDILKRRKIGDFITTVPCLWDSKFEKMPAEEIYEILKKESEDFLNQLSDMILDDHMEDQYDGEGKNQKNKDGQESRPAPMSSEERERLRNDIRQQIIAAAAQSESSDVPDDIARMIDELTNPKMNWRDLVAVDMTSHIKSDYSYRRPSRRAHHLSVVLPAAVPGEEVDIAIAVDASGSVDNETFKQFMSEIRGIMSSFTGYNLHVFCFHTSVVNPMDFTSENLLQIEDYELPDTGGTDFDCIFDYLKERGKPVKQLVILTDGECSTWGDPMFTDTTWVLDNPSQSIVPPFGKYAYFS